MGGGARGAVEAAHLPADHGRAVRLLLQSVQGVEGDEGVVGADLNPQVAVTALRVEGVGGEAGHRHQRGRGAVGEAGLGEEGAAEAEGDGQGAGPGIEGDLVVVDAWAALGHRLGRGRPAAHRRGGVAGAGAGGQVEGDEVADGLQGVVVPAWWVPWKGTAVWPTAVRGRGWSAAAYAAVPPAAPVRSPVAPDVPSSRLREMTPCPAWSRVVLSGMSKPRKCGRARARWVCDRALAAGLVVLSGQVGDAAGNVCPSMSGSGMWSRRPAGSARTGCTWACDRCGERACQGVATGRREVACSGL